MPRPPRGTTLEQRFWSKVDIGSVDECWNWIAGFNSKGYGSFWKDGAMKVASRVSYEFSVGPIPEGLHIDHLCRNPPCVNPNHLEPVTLAENVRRGVLGQVTLARLAKITHCPKGHEYTPENTGLHPGKKRFCRTCSRAKCRAYYQENKQRLVTYARDRRELKGARHAE